MSRLLHHQVQREKPPPFDLKQYLFPPKILRDNDLHKAGFGEAVTTARSKTLFYKEQAECKAPA
jgi:hypothetical protein